MKITINTNHESMIASLLEMVAVRRRMGGHAITQAEKKQMVEWARLSVQERQDVEKAITAHITLGVDMLLGE